MLGSGGTSGGAGSAGRVRSTPACGRTGSPVSFVAALAPGARVPVGEQILVQLAGALRAGRLAPGDRLPSVRALARRLGVHRNTVRRAYRSAAARGLLDLRPGSGAYVAGPPGADDPFRSLVARERAAGGSYDALRELMDGWRSAVEARRVTVVGSGPALLDIWARELSKALAPVGVRVSTVTRDAAERSPRRLLRTVVAATAATLEALEPVVPRSAERVLLRPGPPRRLPRLLASLPGGSVLAVASRSTRLAGEVRGVAASLRGEDVAVVRVDPVDARRAARVMRVARFVLADVVARGRLEGRVEARRTLTLRHLPRSTGRDLARAFGPRPTP